MSRTRRNFTLPLLRLGDYVCRLPPPLSPGLFELAAFFFYHTLSVGGAMAWVISCHGFSLLFLLGSTPPVPRKTRGFFFFVVRVPERPVFLYL